MINQTLIKTNRKKIPFALAGTIILYILALIIVNLSYTVSAADKSAKNLPVKIAQNSAPAAVNSPAVSPSKPASPQDEDTARAANRKTLQDKLESYVKNDPAWINAKVGICFKLADCDEIIYQKNSNSPMIPASNLKVITTAAALSLLGPDYRFETSLWGSLPDEKGVIKGNLYIKGTGDPTFMDPFTNNPTNIYRGFANALKKRGVKAVEGDLIGDDSAFDREFLGRGWKSRYLICDYAAPAGALSVNGNLVSVSVRGGQVKYSPANRYMKAKFYGGNGGVYIDRKLGTDQVMVKGYSGGSGAATLTINNPSKFSTAVFAEILRLNGIEIRGKVRLITPEDANYQAGNQKIAFHRSCPLHEIVKEINKESDNICAQHVFKAIGYAVKGKGTCDNSNAAIQEWMKNAGIDSSCFAMADGSGLSVYNRITPNQMCQVLTKMTKDPNWKYFWTSLPIAGVDGTMDYRLYNLPIRAKTGGLKGHIALSGYVKTKAGQTLVFAMFTNSHNTSGDRIRQNEDSILKIIANYNKKI